MNETIPQQMNPIIGTRKYFRKYYQGGELWGKPNPAAPTFMEMDGIVTAVNGDIYTIDNVSSCFTIRKQWEIEPEEVK